jgi:hypothetical protein
VETEILAILCVFGIPLSVIWTSHRRKMMELQLKLKQQGSSDVQGSINSLREEVRQLRDTTMQYDLSFDAAMQRMEQRVEGLERRVSTQPTTAVQESTPQNVVIGR